MRNQCVAKQAVIPAVICQRGKMKTVNIEKCPGCGSKHNRQVQLKGAGRNSTVTAFCDSCVPVYRDYLRQSDEALVAMRFLREDAMGGWGGRHPNSRELHVCVVPRPELGVTPAGTA